MLIMESTCFGFEEDEPVASSGESTAPVSKFVKPQPPPTTFRFMCTVTVPKQVLSSVENVDIPLEKSKNEQTLSPSPEKPVSITQIQELLLQDLNNPQESAMNSTMVDETSIYEEETESSKLELSPIKMLSKKGRVEKETTTKVADNTVTVDTKRKRATKKKTKQINDNTENESVNNTECEGIRSKTPVRVFTRATRNMKPVLGEIQNVVDSVDVVKTPFIKPKNAYARRKQAKAKAIEDENNERFDEMAKQINSQFKQVEEFQLLVE